MRTIEKFKQYLKKKKLSTKNNRKKVGIILFATSIGLFFLFVTRLSYIVIVGKISETFLEEKTTDLYQGSEIVKAKRGTIYDRNGEVIAEDATSYSLYAVLSTSYVNGKGDDKEILYAQSKDFDTLTKIIVDVLGDKVSEKKVLNSLKQASEDNLYRTDIPNAKNITLQQKQTIETKMDEKEIKGLYFDEKPSRTYSNGVFASHFIGYADVETDDSNDTKLVGKMGIEEAYNDILSGKDGKIVYQKDNYQNPLPGTVAESEPAVDGKNVYTTLDNRLQSYLETLMNQAWKKVEAEDMTAVLMEAKTGEIVAMSQRPSFNPETKKEFSDEDFLWYNLFSEDKYEPGSTMKILTVASAIDQGIFNPDETYTPGEMDLMDAKIIDWDYEQGAKPSLTMRQALSWSSNVGMVKLEQRMSDRWQRYLQEFGFGRSTYSGLPNETSGDLPEDNIVSKAMTSFGQAINVSQLQMLQSFTAVSNDGQMLKPQMIKKITSADSDDEIVTQPEVVGNPITAEAAQKVREYMRDTVEDPDYGTAYDQYKVPGNHVSVKTGTAQVAKDGVYLTGDNSYLYSSVTMVPTEDPAYVLYVTLKQPKEKDSTIIPNLANQLLKRAMDLYDVDQSNDQEESNERVTVPDYRDLETETAAGDAQKRGLNPVVLGDGDKVVEQSITNGKKVLSSEKILLLTKSQQYQMPDTTGWSKSDLIKLGELLQIEVQFDGDGFCTKQSLAPYETVGDQTITFTLE